MVPRAAGKGHDLPREPGLVRRGHPILAYLTYCQMRSEVPAHLYFHRIEDIEAGVVMCLVSHWAEELHLHQDMRAMCVPPARGLTAHLDLSGKYMGHKG